MFDAIAARRSIRKFKNTPVPRHIRDLYAEQKTCLWHDASAAA